MNKILATAGLLLSLSVLFTACGGRQTVSEDENGRMTDSTTRSTVRKDTESTTRATTRATETTLPTETHTSTTTEFETDGMTETDTNTGTATEDPALGRQRRPGIMGRSR